MVEFIFFTLLGLIEAFILFIIIIIAVIMELYKGNNKVSKQSKAETDFIDGLMTAQNEKLDFINGENIDTEWWET